MTEGSITLKRNVMLPVKFTRAASRARALAHSSDERRDNERNSRSVFLLVTCISSVIVDSASLLIAKQISKNSASQRRTDIAAQLFTKTAAQLFTQLIAQFSSNGTAG